MPNLTRFFQACWNRMFDSIFTTSIKRNNKMVLIKNQETQCPVNVFSMLRWKKTVTTYWLILTGDRFVISEPLSSFRCTRSIPISVWKWHSFNLLDVPKYMPITLHEKLRPLQRLLMLNKSHATLFGRRGNITTVSPRPCTGCSADYVSKRWRAWT